MKTHKIFLFLLSLCTLQGCDFLKKEEDRINSESNFEGTLEFTETRGIEGNIAKSHTRYWISDKMVKREKTLGGINLAFQYKSGTIIDFEKDSVTAYYSDLLTKKKLHLSIDEFTEQIKEWGTPLSQLDIVDYTFCQLDGYANEKRVSDSANIQGLLCDYSKFSDKEEFQEIFHSKDIKIKRKALEILFPKIPKECHFPVSSLLSRNYEQKIQNDTVIQFLDTSYHSPKSTKHKVVDLSLMALKKGLDIYTECTNVLSKVSSEPLKPSHFSFPDGDFEEVDSLDEFLRVFPVGGDD